MTPFALPLIKGALWVRGSTCRMMMTCHRQAKHYLLDQRSLVSPREALVYGTHIHSALRAYYWIRARREMGSTGLFGKELECARKSLLRSFTINPTPLDSFRNLSQADATMCAYDNLHQSEPFVVLTAGGRPMIEVVFALLLGHVRYFDQSIPVIWVGKIDMLTVWDDGVYVMDHKTTSIFGPVYFNGFQNDVSQLGYCWAASRTLRCQVKGFVINVLVGRRPSKTGVPIEFGRNIFPVNDEMLSSWQLNTLHVIQQFVDSCARGYCPQHTNDTCHHKYGLCQYFDVCSQPASAQTGILHSNLFQDEPYNVYANERTIPNEN